MAKKSKLAKAQKQQAAVDRFIDYRNELKANGEHEQLNRLPKDSSPVRLRNRCAVTGRPRGSICVNSACRASRSGNWLIKARYRESEKQAGKTGNDQ